MNWNLPSHGWKGYVRPSFRFDNLSRAMYEREVAAPQEAKFTRWLADTVYGAAINRAIADIGRRA